ncbi:acetyltransferase, GNAT family [Paecilomyces variotii No. 5]|uniref:Acetyltransferase, GNAT family n=1 Tax=Byssochlamys spectabilis (strain No. 5 / NBRC 109023) TaxID=1356009 RepID=V5G4Y5_BYSSN|nr:acetyltransferase, GNAT family [Paecilomyces variotii No. 5]
MTETMETTDQPSRERAAMETTGAAEPSNPGEISASTGGDLSRISSRAGIAVADGVPLEEAVDDEDDDEDVEEADEEYIAVDHDDMNDFSYYFRRGPVQRQRTAIDELHPFVQTLTLSNLEDCIRVEEAFPEHERCSKEKFVYRLTKCPELSLGLFTLPVLEPEKPKPRPELVAHVIATRTKASQVTDAAMSLPPNWETRGRNSDDCDELEPGHHEWGSTICVHSLAVVPEHQGKKIGSTLMKSYVQRIKEAEIADRIALLAHDDMIGFYENLGFENRGPSKCQFGGGGWSDMILEFSKTS